MREWLIPRVFYNPRATVPLFVGKYLIQKKLCVAESEPLVPEDWARFQGRYNP